MKIALIEPFFTGSHALWSHGLQKFSSHEIQIFSLKGKFWKWRMYGGAVELAHLFLESHFTPDLVLASDMLDLATFMALTKKKIKEIPCAIYFHENQITYPWSPDDPDLKLKRDNQYGFINYTSALAADALFFNSSFHKTSFIDALPGFLNQFPDYKRLENIKLITAKSQVLALGMDLQRLATANKTEKKGPAILLWNHRWEYDKKPEAFFALLFKLKAATIPFQLIVLGKSYARVPAIFETAKDKLAKEMIHFGYAENQSEYVQLLHKADILPVTSQQDFFGGSIVEAIYCDCHPILPKRLAYPEHIPLEKQATHLYDTEEEAYQKLKTAIQNISDIRLNAHYSNFVAGYDWRNLAVAYDTTFETLFK